MKIKKQKIIDVTTIVIHSVAVVIVSLFAAGALRQNNLTMLRLREEVFNADKSGVGVEEALKNLRDHVSTHMNTELPRLGDEKAIQLKYSYDRRVGDETKRFQDDTNALSEAAKSYCSSFKNEFSKVDCEQNYIKNNPVMPKAEIYAEEYSIEFVSPMFSFDLAGWLVIVSITLGISLIARIVALRLALVKIKYLYK